MLKRILGLLGWLGVIFVFVAVALRWLPGVKPEWQLWSSNFAIAGLVCTLLYILSQWREVARSFAGRDARYASLAAASIAVVLAILIGINWLAIRRNKRWDLTAAKQHSLSDQTVKILQGIDKPIKVFVFAKPQDDDRFKERLDEYQYHSKHLQVQYMDPERQPTLATKYQPLVRTGTVVFDVDGKIERVNSETEQALTNGLLKVLKGTEKKVYFVQGHDERSLKDEQATGYSTIRQFLLADNLASDELMLSQVRAIPDDATVLVIAGPRTDLFPNEIEMLRAYLARGGKLLCLIDPREDLKAQSPSNLIALLKEWGINTGDDLVIYIPSDFPLKDGQAISIEELGAMMRTDASYVASAQFQQHPLTQGLGQSTVVFRMARSVSSIAEGSNNRFAQSLLETSDSSWGETDLTRLFGSGEVAREAGKGDKAGPVSLGAAVSAPVAAAAGDSPKTDDAPQNETRVVVFGDSDFATNGMIAMVGRQARNLDIFLNAVSWLAQQEDLIAVRPRDPAERTISMTPNQFSFVFWLTGYILPVLLLLAGLRVWWVRR